MKKKFFSNALLFLLIISMLTGCGAEKEVFESATKIADELEDETSTDADNETVSESEEEITDEEMSSEATVLSPEEERAQIIQELDEKLKNGELTQEEYYWALADLGLNSPEGSFSFLAMSPYYFSDGLAWVQSNEHYCAIDTNGTAVLDVTLQGDVGSDTIRTTEWYDGASAVYTSDNNTYGFEIFDTSGEVLYSSAAEGDDVHLRLLSGGGGYYLVYKIESGFSGTVEVVYGIDKNGNVVFPERKIKGNDSLCLHPDSWLYLGDGKFADVYHIMIDMKNGTVLEKTYENQYAFELELYGGDGLLARSGEWYNSRGELCGPGWFDESEQLKVALPEYPDSVDILMLGEFKNGYATVILRGGDKKTYLTMVNNKGEQLFEPIHEEGFDSAGEQDTVIAPGGGYDFVLFLNATNWGERCYIITSEGETLDLNSGFKTFRDDVEINFDYAPDGDPRFYASFRVRDGFAAGDGAFLVGNSAFKICDGSVLSTGIRNEDTAEAVLSDVYEDLHVTGDEW